MIKNIIFDLDGVLFDGCEFHAILFTEAVHIIVPGLNLTREYHDRILNGLTTKQKLKALELSESQCERISTLKQLLTRDSLDNSIKPNEKQKIMCETLVSLKYRLYCVSNSIRSTVETCLTGLQIADYFSGIISNEDTSEPKPSPQPYLTAYSKWGLNPSECVIVEDSPHGVHSARMSGGHVLVVADPTEVTLERILKFIGTL